jgi:PEP-CTERM motif
MFFLQKARLDAINPSTGALSVIGPTGFADCSTATSPGCGANAELSLGHAGGTIYTTDFANRLYTVDPVTGKATLVGNTGIPAVPFIPASTNPDGSFNFYDENLFDVGGKLFANFDAATFNPATSVNTTVIAPALYQIDTNTGAATKIAATDLGLITITSLGGTVCGFEGPTGEVVTLDVTNGNTSFVSKNRPYYRAGGGRCTIPEPASMALAGFGIIGIVVWRLRRRVLKEVYDGKVHQASLSLFDPRVYSSFCRMCAHCVPGAGGNQD